MPTVCPMMAGAMHLRQTREGVDAMGRGRAKAKQTKVARELKYYSPDTDFSSLERELHGAQSKDVEPDPHDDADDDEYEAWGNRRR